MGKGKLTKKHICHWCGDSIYDHTPARLHDCHQRYEKKLEEHSKTPFTDVMKKVQGK